MSWIPAFAGMTIDYVPHWIASLTLAMTIFFLVKSERLVPEAIQFFLSFPGSDRGIQVEEKAFVMTWILRSSRSMTGMGRIASRFTPRNDGESLDCFEAPPL
jgi:hypothetical protein